MRMRDRIYDNQGAPAITTKSSASYAAALANSAAWHLSRITQLCNGVKDRTRQCGHLSRRRYTWLGHPGSQRESGRETVGMEGVWSAWEGSATDCSGGILDR